MSTDTFKCMFHNYYAEIENLAMPLTGPVVACPNIVQTKENQKSPLTKSALETTMFLSLSTIC